MAIMPSIELKGAKFIVVYIALLLCDKATGHPSSSCAYYFTVAKKNIFFMESFCCLCYYWIGILYVLEYIVKPSQNGSLGIREKWLLLISYGYGEVVA